MTLKLPREKKKQIMVILRFDQAGKMELEELVRTRDISRAQLIRELVRREYRSVREAKKTEAA